MDRLDALGHPALRHVLGFLRAAPDPVTTDELAAALDLPRTVARSRLERLAEADLLVTEFERRSGRNGPGAGRPAKTYAVAAETKAIEFPRRRYESLIRLLVDAIPRRRRVHQLSAIGYAFGLELADAAQLRRAATARAALERLCRGLGRLGFQVRVESVSAGEAVLVSRTCPLRPLVVSAPDLSAADQGMWRALAAGAGVDLAGSVRCETRNCLDEDAPCRIVVAFSARS